MGLSWPDDEIRNVIASHMSWQAVARALGFEPSSTVTMRRVKKRAAELGISTAHFIGQRTWTNAQLKEAIQRASSWSDIVRALGLSDTAIRPGIRADALRLGFDVAHLRPYQRKQPSGLDQLAPEPSKMLSQRSPSPSRSSQSVVCR